MYDNGYGVTDGWQGEGEWLGELLAVPLDPRFPEPVRPAKCKRSRIWLKTDLLNTFVMICRSQQCSLISSMRRYGLVRATAAAAVEAAATAAAEPTFMVKKTSIHA